MAKALHSDRPSSSIARLLDPASATRAMEPRPERATGTHTPPEHPAPQPAGGRARPPFRHDATHLKRELVLSPHADETFNRLIEALRRSTGTRLTASHAFRALMRAVHPGIGTIPGARGERLRLPSNAPAYQHERDEFENALARLISSSLSRRD